ncbi:pancreatic lipase-related protein 2-like [Hyperolius riggenbachi]|uniref:pancreatic lipase-related protein 2-like n=1 Tax=Hyperolius riggenbachi TaxID=752182 RepID=UPI0035A2DFC1
MCYGELGCFSNCPPYGFTPERPIGLFPWPPEMVRTRFLLFTRENLNRFQVVRASNVSTVGTTNFNSSRKTIFIIHGFLETGNKEWLVDMCKALLHVSDVNCFCVDWKGGSFAPYSQAANNVRVVGAEVAKFVKYLVETIDYTLNDVYLIGHSLGAQVAGEAGKRQRGIGRITGLDPAGPYFSRTPPEVCLDLTDALFVDAIHTDAISIGPLGLGGFGVNHPDGNADFFPNGGKQQPGCGMMTLTYGDLDQLAEDAMDGMDMLCNHQRSWAYFTASILNPDGFIAYPASSYEAFQEGSGIPCVNRSCNVMGYYMQYENDTDVATSQTYYLNTGDSSDFYRWRFRITVTVTGSWLLRGSFEVSLCKNNNCSQSHEIHRGFIYSGKSYTAFIDDEDNVPVEKVKFSWTKDRLDFIHHTLGASVITVESGTSGKIYKFCGSGVISDGSTQFLDACPSQHSMP